MHEFNARTIETITKALRRCDRTVSLTKTWESLNLKYGIGTPSSTRTSLTLTERDHETLRKLTQRHTAFDPLTQTTDELKGDRMELAGKTRNEKLSGQAVSVGIVMVSSPSGELALASGTYRLPPGATLNVPADELHGTQRVVLIENLQVMYHLARYQWPEGIADLPMLFRGSPQFTPAAVTQALAGVHEVICFADYDPQGLMNCLTQRRACAILLPTDETIHRITAANLDKPADFANQQAAREWLSTLQLPPVKRMLTHKLAISQESMVGSELVVYLLTPVAPRHPEKELMQTNQIERRAVEVFGDRDKAMRWLSKPKRSLGGLTPLTAAATPAGTAVVAEMLERIYGQHWS